MKKGNPFYVATIAALIVSLATLTATPLRAQAPQRVQAGTSIQLRFVSPVSSANASVGDAVVLQVANDVTIGGRVVFKAGAPARGEIVQFSKGGLAGIPGRLLIRLQNVTAVDGTMVPVSANRGVEGDDKMVLSIVLGLVCFVFFFVIKGGPAEIPAGSQIEATTNSDAEVRGGLPLIGLVQVQ